MVGEDAQQGAATRRRDTRQQRGWYVYDWANSSFPTTVITLFFGPYLIVVAQTAIERALVAAAGTLGATLPAWGDEAFRDWVASVVPILTSAAASAGTDLVGLVGPAALDGEQRNAMHKKRSSMELMAPDLDSSWHTGETKGSSRNTIAPGDADHSRAGSMDL